MIKKDKVVLAYSGGLDTSVILKWLCNKGYEVIAYIADVGQKEDFEAARAKALKIGAAKVYIMDLKKEFVEDYIFQMFKGNALYEGRYLLGTAIARPIIAKKQIEIAHKEGARFVAHGATGKGNDQVRFELAFYTLDPQINVIAPWKDKEFLSEFKGRTDLLNYAAKHHIDVTSTAAKPFSEDENLLHISHEAGILESPETPMPEDLLSWVKRIEDTPDVATLISIEFKDGLPIKITNRETLESYTDSLELFMYLNKVGSENGVGVVDMVEDRYIGIKSRGVYETPGGTILLHAHRDIEGIAMDREVMKLRDMLTAHFSELIYNGYWFAPEMDFLRVAIDKSQEVIDGVVNLKIFKGNVLIQSRTCPTSLYDQDLASMDIEGGFDQSDSEGYIKINALRLKAHAAIMAKGSQKK